MHSLLEEGLVLPPLRVWRRWRLDRRELPSLSLVSLELLSLSLVSLELLSLSLVSLELLSLS